MYKCPKCDGEIKPSGFTGRLFCWGKCYHYLSKQEIENLEQFLKENKMTHLIPPAPKDEIIRWYIEKAVTTIFPSARDEMDTIINKILADPKRHHEVIFLALELAVKDVG